MIDFNFPENNGREDGEAREAEPPRLSSPWRADLLILLAAALATIGTFLFEAWDRKRSEAVVDSAPSLELAQPKPPG